MEFNIADLFESLVDTIPDRTALVAGPRRLTYEQLDERANRLANFLRARGVGPGSHVGLHLFNGSEYPEAMLAAFKLRALPININYRYVEAELRYLCQNADLKALITQREFADTVSRVVPDCADLSTVVFLEDGSPPSSARFQVECFDYETALENSSAAREFGPRSGDDRYIIYTGGTTGMPKGVMWRHEDVFFAGLQGGNPGGPPIERPEQLAENIAADRTMALTMLPSAPFIHGSAQWTSLICMFTGGKVVVQPGRSFDAKRVLELIGEEEVTTLTLVGDAMARPIVDLLSAPGASYNTGSLFVIASAGAVLSPTIKEQLRAVFPDIMLVNSFGSTEAGHQGSALPGAEIGVEGRPSFYMDAETNAVFDDERRPIQPGSGKIGWLARGGRVPLGYYKDTEKTAERFVTIDGKRWVLPGDFATVEADGRITVFGRGSHCINTGGEKVFPEEVEEALKSHPDVFDALVVGVEDPRWMQRVAAVVEARPGKQLTLDELQQHCRERIAGYKIPRQVSLVERVMRFSTGKPDYTWAKEVAKSSA
ncbi:MAG TPA: acyl-CoA synthetase [Polyangiaceae bacterium]|nr:acyl-CoA synthetase [Polyangiaceae bacterium]